MGRSSKKSLYDKNISTFEDDSGVFNQKDSEGFIKLNALDLKIDELLNRSDLWQHLMYQ